MTSFIPSFRQVVRTFSRSRGFTLTAVSVIGLAIAVNVAVFAVADVVLFRPIGGPRSGDVVGFYARDRVPQGGYRPVSRDEFDTVRREAEPFAQVLAQEMTQVGVADGDVTRRTVAAVVSPNYFRVLDAPPLLGRGFVDADATPGAERVVVISHGAWNRYHRDPRLLGQPMTINGERFTIVGVAPAWFGGTMSPFGPELWIPLGVLPGKAASSAEATPRRLALVAALKPGVTGEAAAARLAPIAASVQALAPAGTERLEFQVAAVSKLGMAAPDQGGEMASVAFFMMGMAGIVLLIACLNLANLLLARGGSRTREMAVRQAVGAGRARLLGQLVTESLALSLAGAALGVVLGYAATAVLARSLAGVLPFALAIQPVPDGRSVLLAVALAAAAALAFGLGPAIRLSRTDLARQLKESPGDLLGAPGRMGLRHALAVGQMALSLVLLTAAGLFATGAMAAFSANPGFPLERGIVAAVDTSLGGGAPGTASAETLSLALDRVRHVPGVVTASLASSVPYGTDGTTEPVRAAGGRPGATWTRTVHITSDYFRSVRLPLVRGRHFTAGEAGTPTRSPRGVIVDEPLARELWPGQDPLGRQLQVGRDSDEGQSWGQPLEVVGVVPGVRDSMFDPEPGAHLYLPFAADHEGPAYVHASLATAEPGLETAARDGIRRALGAEGANLPVLSVVTLRDHRDTSLYQWIARAAAQVFVSFGVAALVLAGLGVYGVKSYLVACRRREIGIRVAIGATDADILRLIVSDGAWLTAVGLTVGVALAVAVCRLLAGWVYGMPGANPAILVGAAIILGSCALAASYIPARRAVRTAPLSALGRE